MINSLQEALLPSGFATLLFLIGSGAAVFRRTRSSAYPLFAVAAAVILLFSNGLIATLVLSPLEYAHPALQDSRQYPDAQIIVVLTAYAADDDNMPLSAKPNASSVFRILEAANIRSRRPECRVIVSGSATAARIMGHQLLLLGVPDELLTIDVTSNNTAASAEHLKPMIANQQLFLVTSAGHMRRAIGVFRKNGMVPIPAPTDYLLPRSAWHASWTTSPIHLLASDLAVHEYIGLAWYRLTSRL